MQAILVKHIPATNTKPALCKLMNWTQSPLPHFVENETGQFFAPDYETQNKPFPITPADWTHVCSCRFGEARGCGGSTKWSGDSYRYDIFRRENHGRETFALRWWNGAGQGWLLSASQEYRGETSMLKIISQMDVEERRWDMVHFLWETARKSALAASLETSRAFRQAFAEGRVKKKKIRNSDKFEVRVFSADEMAWEASRKTKPLNRTLS